MNFQFKIQKGGLKPSFFFVFILLITSILIYLNSINNDFIFDDESLTIQSRTVVNGGALDIIKSYRPVRYLSYWIDYHLWGSEPWGFRFSNILYHALTVLAVFWLFIQLGLNLNAAFIGAFIFAIHPVHTDAVAYISGRRDLLTALFYILSINSFIEYYEKRKNIWIVAAIIAMALSFFSKEVGATIPLAWLLYVYFREGNSLFSKTWFYGLTMAGLSIFSIFGIFAVQQGGSSFISLNSVRFHGDSMLTHYLTALTLPVYYIKQVVFPYKLLIDNINYPLITGVNTVLIFSVIGLMAYTGIVFFCYIKKYWPAFFFLVFFILSLAPVLQIIPLHEIAAEHYLYLPSVAFCGLIGLLSGFIIKKYEERKPNFILIMFLFILVLFFSWRTVTRNAEMKSWWTLLRAEQKWGELSYRGYYTLAANAFKLRFPDEAKILIDKSIATKYYDSNSYVNYIQYFIRKGMLDTALEKYNSLSKADMKSQALNLDMASVYFINGNCDEVLKILNTLSNLEEKELAEINYLKICQTDIEKGVVQECKAFIDAKRFLCSAHYYSKHANDLVSLLYINKYLGILPDDKDALKFKAEVLSRLGKLSAGAKPIYRDLIEKEGSVKEKIELMQTLAVLDMKTDVPEAIEYLRKEQTLLLESGNQVPVVISKTIELLEDYSRDILIDGKYYFPDW